MRYYFKLIYTLIIRNPAKMIFLTISLCSLFVNLNYIEQYVDYDEKVLTTFEVHGQKYIAVEDDGRTDNHRVIKLSNDLDFNNDRSEIHQTDTTVWFIVLHISFVVCLLVVLISPLEYDARWEFSDICREFAITKVKIDREGSKLYYHYRGKILKVYDTGEDTLYSNKGLTVTDISHLLERFRESPNLYEKYNGTPTAIREDKIDKIVSDEQG